MSIHRPPTENNIYNPSDFIEHDEDDDTKDDDENHLLVSGDEMEGQLIIKANIKFKDFTLQETAYTNEDRVKLDSMTHTSADINQIIVDVDNTNTAIDALILDLDEVNIKMNQLESDISDVKVETDKITPLILDLDEVNIKTNQLESDISDVKVKTDKITPTTNDAIEFNSRAVITASENMVQLKSSNGAYIEGYNTALNGGERQYWLGTSGYTTNGVPLDFYIVNKHGKNIILYPDGGGKVQISSNLETKSLTVDNPDNTSKSITMKSNGGTFIEGFSSSLGLRQFWMGTSGDSSTRLPFNIVNIYEDIILNAYGGHNVVSQSNMIVPTLEINNETQNNAYTDEDHTAVSEIPFLITDLDLALGRLNTAEATIATLQQSATPTGSVLISAVPPTSQAPIGYLHCDGLLVSKTTYSALWNAIGDTYAYNKPLYPNDFYVPDMRQLFVRGGQQNQTYPVSAQSVAMGTYQSQSIQEHGHDYQKPSNTSTVTNFGSTQSRSVWDNVTSTNKTSSLYDSSDQPIYPANAETRPECITMNYIIKY